MLETMITHNKLTSSVLKDYSEKMQIKNIDTEVNQNEANNLREKIQDGLF